MAMTKINKNEFIKQASFVNELTSRLAKDIEAEVSIYDTDEVYTLSNYTRMQNDIVRIRRELLALSKMLDW